MLVVDAHLQPRVPPQISRRGVALAREQLQQSTLAGSVGSHDADPAVHVNTEVDVLEDHGVLLGVPELDVVHLDDRSRELRNLRELQLDGVLPRPLDERRRGGGLLPARD